MPPFLARSSTFAAIVEREQLARPNGMTGSSEEDVVRKSELRRGGRKVLRLVSERAKEDVSREKGVLCQVSLAVDEQ